MAESPGGIGVDAWDRGVGSVLGSFGIDRGGYVSSNEAL